VGGAHEDDSAVLDPIRLYAVALGNHHRMPYDAGTSEGGVLLLPCVPGLYLWEQFMAIFLDRHDLSGLTAADIAEAHRKDLEVQERYGVRFLTYWFDEARGTGFCLIDAPDIATAMRVHEEAHGDVAKDVIEVDLSAVEAFLGRVSDPKPRSSEAQVTFDAALRAIMFTDIVDSTGMTARLGDTRSVEMVRAHDAIVRRALKDRQGRGELLRPQSMDRREHLDRGRSPKVPPCSPSPP